MNRFFSFLLIAVLISAPIAFSQTGTVQGMVADQSGAIVPQVAVHITNVNTGVGYKAPMIAVFILSRFCRTRAALSSREAR